MTPLSRKTDIDESRLDDGHGANTRSRRLVA